MPLLDLVADVRASTPTDAARRAVPDVAEQLELIGQLGAGVPAGRWAAGPGRLLAQRDQVPTGAGQPAAEIDRRQEQVLGLAERARRAWPPGWTGPATT